MNAGTSVQKDLGPEEQQAVSNVIALCNQLMAGGNPHAEPDFDNQGGPSDNDADNNPGAQTGNVMKGSEQGTTPAQPQGVMQPKAAPKEKGMADWNDNEEVKKAFATIAKSLETSTTEGVTARDDGEKRTEEIPEVDEKNVNEVAKALLLAMGKGKVAKSMNAAPATDLTPIMKVMKSMADRIDQQGQIIGEMLTGFQSAAGIAPAPVNSQVQKSQNSNAPFNGGNMVDVIAASVTKSLKDSGVYRQSESGLPVAKGFHRTEADSGEAIRSFSEGIANDSAFKALWNL